VAGERLKVACGWPLVYYILIPGCVVMPGKYVLIWRTGTD